MELASRIAIASYLKGVFSKLTCLFAARQPSSQANTSVLPGCIVPLNGDPRQSDARPQGALRACSCFLMLFSCLLMLAPLCSPHAVPFLLSNLRRIHVPSASWPCALLRQKRPQPRRAVNFESQSKQVLTLGNRISRHI